MTVHNSKLAGRVRVRALHEARLAALREVREMVSVMTRSVGVVASFHLDKVCDAIDTMIAKEEGE